MVKIPIEPIDRATPIHSFINCMKVKRFLIKTVIGLLLGGGAFVVYAQDAGTLQRELQLQLERQSPPIPFQPQKPTEPIPVNPEESKTAVKGFEFKGNTLLTEAQLQAAVKPWSNTLISFSELKNVTAAIQNLYIQNHRIAKVSIPPQEIKDGIILLEIIEGKMGSVIFTPPKEGVKLRADVDNLKRYIRTRKDGSQYIDSQPLERAIALVNELPGVVVTGEFEQGDSLGQSNFRINVNDGPLLSTSVALSNYGSTSTGIFQANASLNLNNPMGYGDQVTLDALQSLGSSYVQLGYSLPVGYDGWRTGVQASYLTFHTLTSAIPTLGNATTVGVNASYALLRNPGNSATLRFSMDDKNYENNQAGENISKYQITSLSAAVNGNFSDSTHSVINYSLTLTSGNIKIINDTQAEQDLSGPITVGRYNKLGYNVSRTQELSFLPKTSWLISAYGQFADKNLNSAEHMYIGGTYAVRAYPVSQGGGSQGVVISSELQYRLDEKWQLGTFADLGVVKQYVNTYSNWQGLTRANNTYPLGAVGATAKYTLGRWGASAIVAFRVGQNPLYNSSGLHLNADSEYRYVQGWIRASYAF